MFKRSKVEKQLLSRISELTVKLETSESPVDKEAVSKELREVVETYKIVKNDNKARLSDMITIDTLVKSGVSLASLYMVMHYEQTEIMVRDGFDLAKRLMP